MAEKNGKLGDRRLGYSGGVGVSSVRILVVEDFEPFRRFISSTLEKKYDLQVVGEVSDGIEAVQKAVKLKPDLIPPWAL